MLARKLSENSSLIVEKVVKSIIKKGSQKRLKKAFLYLLSLV